MKNILPLLLNIDFLQSFLKKYLRLQKLKKIKNVFKSKIIDLFFLLYYRFLFIFIYFYFSDHLPVDCFSKNMSKKEPLSENRTKLWSSFYWGREIQYEWFNIFSLLFFCFKKNLLKFRFFFFSLSPFIFVVVLTPFHESRKIYFFSIKFNLI